MEKEGNDSENGRLTAKKTTISEDSIHDSKTETELLELTYHNRDELRLAYLSFIQGGGLFINTDREYPLGIALPMKVDLPDDNEPLVVSSKVVWKVPSGCQYGGPAGIGVSFVGNAGIALQHCIAGLLKTDSR